MALKDKSKEVLSGAVDKARVDIKALSNEMGGISNQIRDLQGKRDKIQAQIDYNNALLADLEADINAGKIAG